MEKGVLGQNECEEDSLRGGQKACGQRSKGTWSSGRVAQNPSVSRPGRSRCRVWQSSLVGQHETMQGGVWQRVLCCVTVAPVGQGGDLTGRVGHHHRQKPGAHQ